ncbi:cytochrome c biogenesis CcdA family protein [Nocardioides alcanivorans]|uniref:cytochrome c biogenesis CcdA family protein n=1 Tax=Nocardioides alcanivorans TaxID=2897352 RepID=UPI001F227178|nr:cytochrome c biogenesis CcdA family protein [Nocardioides alcanivorans]
MTDFFRETVLSGSLVVALPIAVLAGLVSFFSPCVIPLLPGYLSYATGLSGADLADAKRGRMLAGSLLFVLGFGFVFVCLGALSGYFGSLEFMVRQRDQLQFWLGWVVIALGLVFAGLLPFLQRDVRIHKLPAVGLAAAPLVGFLFGLGWAPCVGPTLSAILLLGVNEATVPRSAVLAGFYALGLGLPFIIAGLAYRRALGAFAFIRRHQVWVTRLGGLMMVLVGLLLVTGWWGWMVNWIQVHMVNDFTVSV